MSQEKGSLSINSENMFPIIKKWLYSDHDIFVRELISNGCDAVTKLKKLEIMGEFQSADDFKYRIDVVTNDTDKTISFTDNGIGMTADEVKQYINNIAFSGAEAFLEKYKDKTNEDQIIGHFGLGFYSAFMVADKVTIDTLSYQDGASAVHWECDGGTEFEMEESDKASQGTTITLHLNEDSLEFANEYKIKSTIEKYCSFMPVEIYYTNENAEPPKPETINVKDEDGNDVLDEAGNPVTETKEPEPPAPLNDTTPLWSKHPNDCSDEDYKEFYRKVFRDFKEPLFWIHLNMDYPFNLKGILYFPRINTEYESLEGTIKLYNNQVFIADNIKEVIPEFLLLLKGAIDCPDLPLNVSRSALQNDGFVKKISDYISKKVADKLSGMCKTSREDYEKYWDDIHPFIKFGCLKDTKFSDKMKDFVLYKNLEGKYFTLPDFLEANQEKTKNAVYYVTDEIQQGQYISLFKEQEMDAVFLTHNIDQPYISHIEQGNEEVKFMRIDSDLTDSLKEETAEDELKEELESLTEVFKKALNNDNLTVQVEKLKNENISAVITLSEESRRMQDMMKMYAMPGMDPNMFGGGQSETLVLNANNSLVRYIFDHVDGSDVHMFCEQIYDLAMLSHSPLSPEAMSKFVKRSNDIMLKLT